MTRTVLLTAIMLAPFALSAAASAATPEEAFERGRTCLSEGDLRGALKEYADAARAAPDNDSYLKEFMLVRNAVLLKHNLAKTEDQKQWLPMAKGLRAFYAGNGLLQQALELDKQIHAKTNTSFTAMQLAETQLALDLNVDAEKVLSALTDKSTTASRALLAIALVRQGKSAEARTIAEATVASDKAGPITLYDLARMQAALGNADESITLLTDSFEATLPSRLDLFKRHAAKCPEFTSIVKSPSFQKALATESKVTESECSSGSSCASCPMRGGCANSGGQ
ncbi:MAG: hypothetical protein H8E44_30720 [Planctomycetes bacterium]|nr:hypothetical protein [Planctomycetota bacterium]MBL7039983.1 hypothetical protein [Pirellulaceae bacterium]